MLEVGMRRTVLFACRQLTALAIVERKAHQQLLLDHATPMLTALLATVNGRT